MFTRFQEVSVEPSKASTANGIVRQRRAAFAAVDCSTVVRAIAGGAALRWQYRVVALAWVWGAGCGARDATDLYDGESAHLGGSDSGATALAPTSGGRLVGEGGNHSMTRSHDAEIGGVATGGVATGGVATGGVATGGVATGGMATGGMATGGMATGGMATAVPLWRNSTKAFCDDVSGNVMVADVWSDARGVFLLSSSESGIIKLSANLGEGWTTAYTWPKSATLSAGGLTGFNNGPLVVYGGSRCSIEFVSGKEVACSSAASAASDVAIVSSVLAYSVYEDRLLQFDGTYWTQLGAPIEPSGQVYGRALWADSSVVLIAANSGRVYLVRSGGVPVLAAELPEVDFTAAWGFSPTDLWIGSADGQLYHYDGKHWSLMWEATGECRGIRALWGGEGTLYVQTSSMVGKWDGNQVTTIDAIPCDETGRYTGLSGTSAKEVFFVLEDRVNVSSGCGSLRLRWYDGNTVRAL